MRADQEIQKLTQEIKSIRTAFEQNASSMKVYTSILTFETSKNTTNWSNSQPYDPQNWESLVAMRMGPDNNRFATETIIVTFDCDSGINTFANLEIDFVDVTPGFAVVSCRRIPYSGGAQWSVTVQPNFSGNTPGQYIWKKSILKFGVQSAAPGVLSARMIWE